MNWTDERFELLKLIILELARHSTIKNFVFGIGTSTPGMSPDAAEQTSKNLCSHFSEHNPQTSYEPIAVTIGSIK